MTGSATQTDSRHHGPAATAADGWTLRRLTAPSRLFGANGIATGPDGRIHVAQVSGSQLSSVDPDSGAIRVIAPMGGPIVAPDDLAFLPDGSMVLTEITEGRVSVLTPDGRATVLAGDLPVANPVTVYQGRIFVGECRMGGRILELYRDGRAPRVIATDVPMPNAFAIGPDGCLAVPVMGANAIWRIDPESGAASVVAADLGVPDSVKFDSRGRIVSTQVATGDVLQIDPQTGTRALLANLGPGLDNCTFVGERLFVSSIPGEITEILPGGAIRPLIPRGLQWPLGLAVDADGALCVADGAFSYLIDRNGQKQTAGMIFWPGYPGYVRGVATGGVAGESAGEWIVTTGLGALARWRPAEGTATILSSGHDLLMGVVLLPGGGIAMAEYGSGRLLLHADGAVRSLADGLDHPMGVAAGPDGALYVAEAGAGRITAIASGRARTLAEGFARPEGLAVHAGQLLVLDSAARTLSALDLATGAQSERARNLPVGAPPGVTPKFLGAIGDMAGPMIPFAGLAVAADGSIFVAGDAEGSVLLLERARGGEQ